MIPRKDYHEYVDDIERGETMRVNHTNCTAGEDTRRRLYLTRPHSSPGMVLAFCHNCQLSGNTGVDTQNYRDFDPNYRPKNQNVQFEVPANMIEDVDEWPQAATIWRMRKKLSKKQIVQAHIEYDPSSHRIYLPQFQRIAADGTPYSYDELMGYQLRHIDGPGAKYLSAYKDNSVKPYTRMVPVPKKTIVLVEDLASALAIGFATKGDVAVLVNYGVKVIPETLYKNVDCEDYLVWLDNDSPHVVDQARHISRTWEMIHNKSSRIDTTHPDPKNLTNEKIRDVIYDGQP